MKKTIFAMTLLSLSLLTQNAFAYKTEFDKIRYELPAKSEIEQKKKFEAYIKKGARSVKSLPIIGYMYYYGLGTAVDKNVAYNMYKRAADNGDSYGMYLLGKYYIEDMGKTEEGLTELVKSTDKGNYYAAEFIGQLYENGKYVEKNAYYSLEYYHKAADLGSSSSKLVIAKKLLESGDEKNYQKGINFLISSADDGETEACLTLSKLYITENKFIELNPSKHVSYLLCAANNNNLEAIKTIADYYARGVIVMIDNRQSALYYERYLTLKGGIPRTKEDAEIYYKAGMSFYSMQKYRKAIDYFKTSAKAGNGEAAVALARIYENGYGVNPDNKLAITYYKLAQKYGIDTSESLLRVEAKK